MKHYKFVLIISILILLAAPGALAQCIDLTGLNETHINESSVICSGTYLMNDTNNNGALILNSSNIDVQCNNTVIVGNGTGIGFNITDLTNVTVRNCTMRFYEEAINIKRSWNLTTINNTFTDNIYGILTRDANTTIHKQNYFETNNVGFNMDGPDNQWHIIENNIIAHGSNGFISEDLENSTLRNNKIYNMSALGGHITVNALWCNVTNNTVYDATVGIIIQEGSYNNSVTDNIIHNNSNTGIRLEDDVQFTIVRNNSVYYNNYGIATVPGSADQNTIYNNYVYNNTHGIFLNDSNNGNITGNWIYNNTVYGINVSPYSSDNIIYNNWFADNGINAWTDVFNNWNVTPYLGTNIIGGPYIGGNYWDDYTGIDYNDDGLGDFPVPYDTNISTGGDYHPLVTQSDCANLSGLNEFNVTQSVTICPGTYYMNDTDNDGAIHIASSNVAVDFNGAEINTSGAGGYAVFADTYTNITLHGGAFYSNTTSGRGIYWNVCTNSTFYNNTFIGQQREAVYIIRSNSTVVRNNTFYNLTGGSAIRMNGGGQVGNRHTTINNTIIIDNIINNVEKGIYLDAPIGWVYNFIDNTIIENNIITEVTNAGLTSDDTGRFTLAYNNTFSNSVIGSTNGIELDVSINSSYYNNIISGHEWGIYAWETDNAQLYNNTIYNNNIGVILDSAYSTSVHTNNITNNIVAGINVTSNSSESNVIFNNWITNNAVNAYDDSYNYTSWNTTPYLGNNIIGGPYIAGNFWDDYTGEDTTGDGLGDTLTPYNSTDNIFVGGDYAPLTDNRRCYYMMNYTDGSVWFNSSPAANCYQVWNVDYSYNYTISAAGTTGLITGMIPVIMALIAITAIAFGAKEGNLPMIFIGVILMVVILGITSTVVGTTQYSTAGFSETLNVTATEVWNSLTHDDIVNASDTVYNATVTLTRVN